jgi:hypothetical protein
MKAPSWVGAGWAYTYYGVDNTGITMSTVLKGTVSKT